MKLTLAACSFLLAGGLMAQNPAPPGLPVFPLAGLAAGAVKNAPFSADTIPKPPRLSEMPNRIVQRTAQKLYRDSDGRERLEQYASTHSVPAQPDRLNSIAISDPVAGAAFTLHPDRRDALRTARVAIPPYGLTNNLRSSPGKLTQSGSRGRSLRPAGPALEKEDLGTRNIEGVNAKGTRITRTLPTGEAGNQLPINIVDEGWYSPELQTNVMRTHNDPRTGDVVYKLTNISRANPPHTLFEVRANYTIHDAAGQNSVTRR
jgi:hypothetical protein